MKTIKTYLIEKTKNKKINPSKLHAEIENLGCVKSFGGVCTDEENIHVLGEEVVSEENLDSIVMNHDPIDPREEFSRKVDLIEKKSKKVIRTFQYEIQSKKLSDDTVEEISDYLSGIQLAIQRGDLKTADRKLSKLKPLTVNLNVVLDSITIKKFRNKLREIAGMEPVV